jgi:hypothetical protein
MLSTAHAPRFTPQFAHRTRVFVRLMALAAIAPVISACSTRTATMTNTPPVARVGEWAVLACETCEPAKIEVSIRHSVDERGRPGKHAYARVRNNNPHPVALVVKFAPKQYPVHDEAPPLEQWKVTVGGAGTSDRDSVLTLQLNEIVEASVHSVERL